jgi:hypothetical protein
MKLINSSSIQNCFRRGFNESIRNCNFEQRLQECEMVTTPVSTIRTTYPYPSTTSWTTRPTTTTSWITRPTRPTDCPS